jgi:hypothetical protein
LYLVYDELDCIPVVAENFSPFLFKYIILCFVLYFSVGKVNRREGENTGSNKGKELFAVMVNLLSQELRGTNVSTVMEQVNVQV